MRGVSNAIRYLLKKLNYDYAISVQHGEMKQYVLSLLFLKIKWGSLLAKVLWPCFVFKECIFRKTNRVLPDLGL
jgi:hypothetical protein